MSDNEDQHGYWIGRQAALGPRKRAQLVPALASWLRGHDAQGMMQNDQVVAHMAWFFLIGGGVVYSGEPRLPHDEMIEAMVRRLSHIHTHRDDYLTLARACLRAWWGNARRVHDLARSSRGRKPMHSARKVGKSPSR